VGGEWHKVRPECLFRSLSNYGPFFIVPVGASQTDSLLLIPGTLDKATIPRLNRLTDYAVR
jgi:hypothetical protein